MPKDGPAQAGLIYGIRLMSAKKAGGTNATWLAYSKPRTQRCICPIGLNLWLLGLKRPKLPSVSSLYLIHASEQAAPPDALKSSAVYIVRPPDEYGFAHHVVFGHEAPVARVGRIVAIIAHHPIVIHLKGVAIGRLIVDVYATVTHINIVAFVHADNTFVHRQVGQG